MPRAAKDEWRSSRSGPRENANAQKKNSAQLFHLPTQATPGLSGHPPDSGWSECSHGTIPVESAGVQGGAMKVACAVVLALCLIRPCGLVSGQNVNSAPSSEQEIRTLEDERNRAILKGDASALERMTADDYTFITLRGELRTKSEIVKGFQSGS